MKPKKKKSKLPKRIAAVFHFGIVEFTVQDPPTLKHGWGLISETTSPRINSRDWLRDCGWDVAIYERVR